MLRKRPSTTCPTCGSTITRPPARHRHSAAEGGSSGRRGSGARAPVTVTLQFLPGGEPWCQITCGDLVYRRPGSLQVWELVLWLNGWW